MAYRCRMGRGECIGCMRCFGPQEDNNVMETKITKKTRRMTKMIKMIKMSTIREFYRVDAEYWETGDVDLLPARSKLAHEVCERFWTEMGNIMHIVTAKKYPVEKFVEVIRMLGFDVEEEDDDADRRCIPTFDPKRGKWIEDDYIIICSECREPAMQ